MFFGGFSGATAFYPDKVTESRYVPPIVLTDFRLSGAPVEIGAGSPLEKSITYSNTLRLSHRQNMFSLEFSALSYSNPATNRYRYKLEGLDSNWHEVGSEQRLVNYTTLPARSYVFRVQGATSQGPWRVETRYCGMAKQTPVTRTAGQTWIMPRKPAKAQSSLILVGLVN